MGHPPASTFQDAEYQALRRVQLECFPEDYQLLKAGKSGQSNSQLLCLSLEYDEAILNSKPLGYVSSDLADPDPVTPNSPLMGRPDGSLPQVVYPESELLGRKRWRHSRVLADRFWAAFVKQYQLGLQTGGKWQTPSPDVDVGMVVMLVDPQLPRSSWQIGRVTKVFPGADGRVRTVKYRYRTGCTPDLFPA